MYLTVALRVGPALAGPTVRAMRWRPFLGAAAAGLFLVAIPLVFDVDLAVADLIRLSRVAAVCGGLGVAFLLDDPSTRSVATLPVSRLARHAVRVAVALPVAGLWWAAAVVVSRAGAPPGVRDSLAHPAVTLEAAAICAAALALAAAAVRGTDDGTGSTLAAPMLLSALVGAALLPASLVLFPPEPQVPAWSAAHHRWQVVLVAALVGAVLASLDRSGLRRRAPAANG